MKKKHLNWNPDLTLAVGKGATNQRFTSSANGDELEIDTHPWGEADLTINGKNTAHVEGKSSAGEAFREIEDVAEQIEDDKSRPDEV